MRKRAGDFNPAANTIQIMTMHASKGLEWPVVAVVTSEEERRAKDVEKDGALEARLVYVASTRSIESIIFI